MPIPPLHAEEDSPDTVLSDVSDDDDSAANRSEKLRVKCVSQRQDDDKRREAGLRNALEAVEKLLTGRFLAVEPTEKCNKRKKGQVCAMVVAEEENVELEIQGQAIEAYHRMMLERKEDSGRDFGSSSSSLRDDVAGLGDTMRAACVNEVVR